MEEHLAENSTISVTRKATMLKGSARRNSIGSTAPRSSPSHSSKDEKSVPHYLRASTGSCHDLCKYGHRNPFEEEEKVLGWRRKKQPIQLKNSALQRSAILDRSKDVKHRSLSLAKSSMSLGEADRIGLQTTSPTWKDIASYKPAVPRAAPSADQKSLNSDGRKKQPVVEPKAPSNSRTSNGVPKFDQKVMMPVKKAIPAAQPKLVEKTLPEKPNTWVKARLVKQPLFTRPISSPSQPHMIKQMSMPSRRSNDVPSKPLISSKDKYALKGKLTSQPTTSSNAGVQQSNKDKAGRTLKRSSMVKINGKKDMDMSGASFSAESELTAAVEIQEDGGQAALGTDPNEEKTLYVVEPESCKVSLDCFEQNSHDQQLSEPPSAAKECVQESRSAPEESSRSNSEDEGVESNKNDEASEGEDHMKSTVALGHSLQQSSPAQELKSMLSISDPEHEQAEQHIGNGEASKDEDDQPTDAALCQLSKRSAAGEDADAPDSPLTEPTSEIEVDGAKAISNEESPIAEGIREVGAHEDLQGPPEPLRLDERHSEESEPILRKTTDCTSGKIAESIRSDETDVDSMKIPATPRQPSEASSHDELLEEPKSVLSEPSDSTVQNGKVASVRNDDSDVDSMRSPATPLRPSEASSHDELLEEPKSVLSEPSDSTVQNGTLVSVRNDDSEVDSMKNPATPRQPSEASSHDELLEEPKSVLSEPSDSTVQNGKVVSVRNDNSFEGEEIKSTTVTLQQLPEALSDDEFTEESDFEFSESDESVSENDGTESNRNDVKAEGRRQRRTSALRLDGTTAKPYKLKFKRGKIVELPPDSNGPRRLKFRRRVATEVASTAGQQARSYKRNGIDAAVPNNPNVEAPGVKLRHQDAQGKKDAQGLFNNVIEETASKLVESRKSKVKALVGAFETVISLQDGKPVSSTPQAGSPPHPVHDDGENAHD